MVSRVPDLPTRAALAPIVGFDPEVARFHVGPDASQAARDLRAEAFTIGTDVFFGEGKYDPHSKAGLALIAHELTHVAQQGGLAVKRKSFLDDDGGPWEAEARAVGARVLAQETRGLHVERCERYYMLDGEPDQIAHAQNRLNRISTIVMERLEDRLADRRGYDARQIVIPSLDVEIDLDLDNLSDDACVEIWLRALLATIEPAIEAGKAPPAILPAPLSVQLGRKGDRKDKKKKKKTAIVESGEEDDESSSSEDSRRRRRSRSRSRSPRTRDRSRRRSRSRSPKRRTNEDREGRNRRKMLKELLELQDERVYSDSSSEEKQKKQSHKRKLSSSSSTKSAFSGSSGDSSDSGGVSGSYSNEESSWREEGEMIEYSDEYPIEEEKDPPKPTKPEKTVKKPPEKKPPEKKSAKKSAPKKSAPKKSSKDVEVEVDLEKQDIEEEIDDKELHFSSEDDEVADEERVRSVQQFIIALKGTLNEEAMKGLPLEEGKEKVTTIVEGVREHRRVKKGGKFPLIFNETNLPTGLDWIAFVIAMKEQIELAKTLEKEEAKKAKEKEADKDEVEEEIREEPKKKAPTKETKKATKKKRKNSEGESQVTEVKGRSEKTATKKKRKKSSVTTENTNKPTSYNIVYPIWKGATFDTIAFRGRKLYQPTVSKPKKEPDEGRSWAAIARSMNIIAIQLGGSMIEAGASVVRSLGHRALALAILYIFAGHGDEVRERLVEMGMEEGTLQGIEKVVLEFMALAIGVEGIRMPFLVFDTFLHLAFIASGETYGRGDKLEDEGEGGSGDRDDYLYDFENVLAPLRTIRGEVKHVFAKKEGVGRPPYIGLNVTGRKEAQKKDSATKSVQTAGKSSYSHGVGHKATEGYLSGGKRPELLKQVRKVELDKRRALHRDRLAIMGPIRLHNLFANLLKKHPTDLDKSNEELAVLFKQAFLDFATGEVSDEENPFHNVFPSVSTVSFSHALEGVMTSTVANTYEKLEKETQVPIFKKIPPPKDREESKVKGEIEMHDVDENIKPAKEKEGDTIRDLVREALKVGKKVDEESLPKEQPKQWQQLSKEKEKWETPTEKTAPTKVMPSKSLAVKKKLDLGNVWMNDRELGYLLREEEAEDVHVTAAVNVLRHPAGLATLIRDDFMHLVRNGRGIPRFTIVPINLGNRHWTMLVIEQNPDRRSAPRCYYFNSMGADQSEVNLIESIVQASNIYTNTVVHNLTVDALQEDGVTCGSWALAAAQTIVNQRREQEEFLDEEEVGLLAEHITLGENAKTTHRENMEEARRHL
ncbi:MAG TPA: DUF4157 domain-containing protein [Fimbriimonadaceae bacterium]|nr:DUF4157 domain-containing protein [Fimbriimonadaceae bacterium]